MDGPDAANLALEAEPTAPALRAPSRKVDVPAAPAVTGPRVGAIIVTWNRKQAVDTVLRALSRQRFPGRLDVVVVDNGSSDGTPAFLAERWNPDRVVDNGTAAAHEPQFHDSATRATDFPGASPGKSVRPLGTPERGAIASLTLIRNAHNLGGCGGFNTGLAYLEQFLDGQGPVGSESRHTPLDYAWLVDDDVDLPENALAQLARTADRDHAIGLVGSRTVDFDDRQTTIETTIYFDFENGWMGPDPHPGHRLHDEHRRWAEEVGGTRGRLPFRGQREVDVVSACSLLARWSAVKRVGFWDRRYFIYCDDADWSLRFGAAGYRVVCDLDAVVYHTYWLSKLTPARAYYSQRNLVWMIQKVLPKAKVRRAVFRRLASLLVDSRKAATHCRLFHAEIIRRTAHDIVTGRGGKLESEGPAFKPLLEAFDEGHALRPTARILVMCSHPESIRWADDLRTRIAYHLADAGRAADQPQWVYACRDHVPHEPRPNALGLPGPRRVVFAPSRQSKWEAQREFFRDPADAVVVFDQSNELPLIRSRFNIHVDRRRPDMAQTEIDGWRPRLRFFARWAGTALRCLLYIAAARPRPHSGKYGG